MIVLSLFDGISAGRVALERAGIPITKYLASEIDPYAIKIAMANYPDTTQLGDVTKWREWDIDLSKIDLLLAGFPCQAWSMAGNQGGDDDPRGALVHDLIDIWSAIKKHNPEVYFLFENVRMKTEFITYINKLFGVDYVEINSSLVSAQNRKRLYWTNIPGDAQVLFGCTIGQPKDKGILLKDILDGNGEKCVVDAIYKNRPPRISNEKSPCLRASQAGGLLVVDRDKAHCIDANYAKVASYEEYKKKHRRQLVGCIQIGEADLNGNDSIKRVYSPEGKGPCLTTMGGGHREPKVSEDLLHWRKLTPLECERLQTFDDNYTNHVSKTRRYHALGNSWTVDVIVHIMKGLKK